MEVGWDVITKEEIDEYAGHLYLALGNVCLMKKKCVLRCVLTYLLALDAWHTMQVFDYLAMALCLPSYTYVFPVDLFARQSRSKVVLRCRRKVLCSSRCLLGFIAGYAVIRC